jgi:hypothetical protein
MALTIKFNLRRIDPWRDHGEHAAAQRDDSGIIYGPVAELLFTARAFDERYRNGVIDAELALETGLRSLLARQFKHQRVTLRSTRSIWFGSSWFSLRNWMAASIAGCITIPHANGLYVFSKAS